MNSIGKKSSLVVILVTLTMTPLFLFSCKNEPSELTSKEKETIKKEISARINEIVKGAKQLDIEAAMKPYSNSETFLIINPDGSFSDYNGMKNANAKSFKEMSSLNFTTINEEFRFLTNNQVLYTWFGKSEVELKSGEKMKFESYVGTMLFSKINNEWKIVYAHESASPPVVK